MIGLGRWATAQSVSISQSAPPAKTWEFHNGVWEPVQSVALPVSESNATLDAAEKMIEDGQPDAAHQVLIQWEHTHKDSPIRDRCIYLLAQSAYASDDWITSFYYLDEVMDEYPESRLFYPAVEMQYRIADGYLSGHKNKFLGMPILSANDEAIEMLYRIQLRVPGSALAEKAILRTADFYYYMGAFDYAADTYGYFVRNFPRSPSVPFARLREAFASLAQFRGLKFDATPLVDARAQFLDIERDYPRMAEEVNIPGVIERIDSAFAGKIFTIADFYRRTGEPKAEAFNDQFLVNTYPDSAEAAEARIDLARLPAWTKAPPNPPPSNSYVPTTEPADSSDLDQ
ncbi:MAG TPA: outer membrane protein assembly factor BamD [Tepidisphaeraceae bacterium]|nr:outer membrane protein assembly factor BamD [Tepidisphaeraceae bacterium]